MGLHIVIFIACQQEKQPKEQAPLALVQLAGVATVGFLLTGGKAPIVDASVGWEHIVLNQRFEIDVVVAAKLGRVLAEQPEKPHRQPEKTAREYRVIQLVWQIRRKAIRVLVWVARGVKSADSAFVQSNVVGMVIAPDRVVSDDYLRPQFADVARNLLRHIVYGGHVEAIRVLVFFRAGHIGIAVAEEMHARDAHLFRGATQFGRAQFGYAAIALQEFGLHRACFASGAAEHVNFHALRSVIQDRAAHAEGFVIGVRGNNEECSFLLHKKIRQNYIARELRIAFWSCKLCDRKTYADYERPVPDCLLQFILCRQHLDKNLAIQSPRLRTI